MLMTKTRSVRRGLAVSLAVLLAASGWAVTPGTPQLPNPGSAPLSRQEQEKLGLQTMAEVYKQMPVLPDSNPVSQYVQQLGRKLVAQIPAQSTWPYQFHVVQQKEINAFALPGGPIFINVGTIDAAQNESQLAGVMSHEMSHVYMQHTAKSVHRQELGQVLGALGAILGNTAAGSLARLGMIGVGTVMLRYSRTDEAQADSVGAIIMYKADYNPMELANFFEILGKQGGSPPQFLSDHPNPGNRSAAIEKEIRNWPPERYLGDSQSFQTAKREATSVRAYSAQEIADGAKQGVWAKQNMKTGAVPASAQETVTSSANSADVADVTLEQVRPSSQFTAARQDGLSIAYPTNWTAASGQNSLTIAPRAGVSQNAIAYGMIVNTAEDSNAGSLDQVAQDLLATLQRSNPGLRQQGSIKTVEVNGTPGRAMDLVGTSPVQQNGSALPERDRVVLMPGPGGSFVYAISIAPERDFGALEPTYKKMLDSLRLE
jgi:beta-barrel assembly-enhancing protease